jgi:hypothetical protein
MQSLACNYLFADCKLLTAYFFSIRLFKPAGPDRQATLKGETSGNQPPFMVRGKADFH